MKGESKGKEKLEEEEEEEEGGAWKQSSAKFWGRGGTTDGNEIDRQSRDSMLAARVQREEGSSDVHVLF